MKKTTWILLVVFSLIAAKSSAQIGAVLWQEDFNTLNTTIWNVVTGDGTGTPAGAGWGNQELEYYNTPNVYIADVPGESGNKALVLESRAEAMGTRAFTSGKVTSSGKLSVKYGVVEMRIRVPNLQTGLWPAGWLLGTATANWPANGEIDMMEMGHSQAERTRQGFPNAAINNFVGSNLIFYSAAAVSSGNPSGAASIAYDVNYDNPYVAPTALNDRFVLYRMYWSSDAIRFTIIDGGVETDLYASPFSITSESDEFQNPFYFILNLAVGGTFTDATSNGQVTAPMPGKMYVDYIKVSKWNNQGEVTIGAPAAETGTFGVFTDNTPTTNKLVAGTTSDIYAWNNFAAGTTAPYEGSNVIAWATTDATAWFGGGIASKQPRNMSNFTSGNLKFRIKIPSNVNFKIGMTDTYTNEKYISFPANTTQYGLTRDGNWGQVTIPISQFAGTMAFQSMNYLFAIVSDGTLPTSTFQLGLDDIYWEGGGGTTVAVTGVTVSPTTASIGVGATTQLTATVAPSNATTQTVTWSSSNTAIASVNSSGLVTGVAAGNATITVTTQSGSKTATCAVTVTSNTIAVTGVTVSPTTASIAVGATTQLTATVAPSNATTQTVTWSSSNTAIATVNSSGLVTGVAAGNATITVTTQSGAKTATCAVTVSAVANNLALNKTTTVSSTESADYPGSYAVDASATTRWSSAFSDPQWIYVDLGASYSINRVKITWEAAYGRDFLVQVSADASAWNTMKTVTGNTVLINDFTGLSGTGRYVRIYGTARGTVYGYSIFGLEVYGTAVTGACSVASVSGDYSSSVSNDASNPSLTFVPSRTGVGSTTCILYYGTSATGVLAGYYVTPNTAYKITASAGQVIYYYYTYSVPEGGEKNTAANRNSFTVGTCSSLKNAGIATGENKEISIFPNPAGNQVFVQGVSRNSKIELYNVGGQLLMEQMAVNNNLQTIELSSLQPGVYIVKVVGENSKTLKLIKK